MKIPFKDMKNGVIAVIPQSLDDLWHLEKIIAPKDSVEGTTLRRVKGKDDQIGKDERVRVFIQIDVDQVELHKNADMLRVKGTIT
ncbi:MAG: hypothetical protein GOV15_02015, partial [Candidatus Diapherotrites archaeon]|nr:hypothetical protein [Candidatus Diapherotrites archaeon]